MMHVKSLVSNSKIGVLFQCDIFHNYFNVKEFANQMKLHFEILFQTVYLVVPLNVTFAINIFNAKEIASFS